MSLPKGVPKIIYVQAPVFIVYTHDEEFGLEQYHSVCWTKEEADREVSACNSILHNVYFVKPYVIGSGRIGGAPY